MIYNAVLAAVVSIYFAIALPASKDASSTDSILVLFILAVLANVAYCAAYLVDIFAQMSNFREVWFSARWIVFVVGLVFAAVLTRFFAESSRSSSSYGLWILPTQAIPRAPRCTSTMTRSSILNCAYTRKGTCNFSRAWLDRHEEVSR